MIPENIAYVAQELARGAPAADRPAMPENIAYVAQELARGAPAADRPAMLENIAKALTKHLLQDNPGIGAREAIGARYGGKSGNSDSLMTESRGLSAK